MARQQSSMHARTYACDSHTRITHVYTHTLSPCVSKTRTDVWAKAKSTKSIHTYPHPCLTPSVTYTCCHVATKLAIDTPYLPMRHSSQSRLNPPSKRCEFLDSLTSCILAIAKDELAQILLLLSECNRFLDSAYAVESETLARH